MKRRNSFFRHKAAVLSVLLAMCLVLAGCASSGSKAAGGEYSANAPLKLRYSMGSVMPESALGVAAAHVTDAINTAFEGRVVVETIALGSIGGDLENIKAVQTGGLDMTLSADMSINAVIGGMEWAWLPYMITSYEDADKYYYNGFIGEALTEIMLKSNIVRLGAFENGFRVVGNNERELLTIKDYAGLKIRVPDNMQLVRFYELTGALSTALATSEIITSLEQGTIDGVDNTYTAYTSTGYADMLKYVTLTNHCYAGGSVIFYTGFWDKLTPEDQELMRTTVNESSAWGLQMARDMEEDLKANSVANGVHESITGVSEELDAELRKIGMQVFEEYKAQNPDNAYLDQVAELFQVS